MIYQLQNFTSFKLKQDDNNLHHYHQITNLFDYKGVFITFGMFTVIMMLTGLIGNLFTICSILTSKTLRNDSTCLLCLNISFADLMLSIFLNGMVKVG